ncbi:MAG: hypothetical protein QOF78_54 [Phycisphaerales bacterium]|jgi:hypothetical protein|nr:hypothetical protein [Phycisphaerales bacterium]
MTKKLIVLSSILLLGCASFASAAASQTRYVARPIQEGPSHWGIVLVPITQHQHDRDPAGRPPRSHERARAAAATNARGVHGDEW